jgi:hypothetical protein
MGDDEEFYWIDETTGTRYNTKPTGGPDCPEPEWRCKEDNTTYADITGNYSDRTTKPRKRVTKPCRTTDPRAQPAPQTGFFGQLRTTPSRAKPTSQFVSTDGSVNASAGEGVDVPVVGGSVRDKTKAILEGRLKRAAVATVTRLGIEKSTATNNPDPSAFTGENPLRRGKPS